MTAETDASINRTARLAGALYLSLVPLGFFSFVYVPSALFVRGDVAATSRNVVASEWLYRAGIVSHLISQIIVVFLVLAFYRLLHSVNKDRAFLMVVLALLCVPISFLTEANNFAALRLFTAAEDAAFTAAQLRAQAILFIEIHRSGILIAQVFWALWMLPLSWLVAKSRFLPRVLAVPVLIASAGYLIDSGIHLLGASRAPISQFTAVGELVLPLWLLIKGGDVAQRQHVTIA
jgi:hypothetical protein